MGWLQEKFNRLFEYARRESMLQHQRRSFSPALEGFERRALLSIANHGAGFVGNLSVDSAGATLLDSVGNSAPNISPLSYSANKTATDSKTGATGSFAVSLDEKIADPSGDSGSVTVSDSFNLPTGSAPSADVEVNYEIVGFANAAGTITVNYTNATSTSDKISAAEAHYFDGRTTYSGSGSNSYPVVKGGRYDFKITLTVNHFTFSSQGGSAQASSKFSWQFMPPAPPPASAEIDINDTPAKSDNITLFNPTTTGEGCTQTIGAKVINTSNATQTF